MNTTDNPTQADSPTRTDTGAAGGYVVRALTYSPGPLTPVGEHRCPGRPGETRRGCLARAYREAAARFPCAALTARAL